MKVTLIDGVNYADQRDIFYKEFYEKIRKQKPKQNFYGSKNQIINVFYIFFTLENYNPLGFQKLTVKANVIILKVCNKSSVTSVLV